MKLRKTKNGRYHLLDTVRGLCIAGMVVYHALFDCVYVFGLFSVSEAAMQAVLVVVISGVCFLSHWPASVSISEKNKLRALCCC